MKKKKTPSENTKIYAAALRLATHGCAQVTLDALAEEAKITPAKIKQLFTSSEAIASFIFTEITREALASAGKISGTTHDILFDLLMSRFDIMQKNRRAILNIADVARRDCGLARFLAKAAINNASLLVDASKIKTPPRPVLALGIAAVNGWAFNAWRKDESRDMAKTMAALDRALRLAGKAAGLLTRSS